MNFTNGVAWEPTGFRVEVQRITGKRDRFIKVEDLNPSASIKCRVSRWDCARLGALLLWRAVFARTPAEDAARWPVFGPRPDSTP